MLNTKFKTISAVVTAALLSGCSSSGAFVVAQCTATATTLCNDDAVTVSMPVNVATGVGQVTTATGLATVLGATHRTVTLDPVTGNPVSMTISGGVNTSVAVLTRQGAGDPNPGSFTGTAANGQSVLLTSFSKPNVMAGINGVPPAAVDKTFGLTYSDFGEWLMKPAALGAGTATYSVWSGGTQLTTAMPTTGSATYKGVTRGISLVNATNTPYQLNGNLTLTADFAARSVTGNITGISAATYPGNGIPGTPGITTLAGGFNDIALAGSISGNGFSGTATAGALPSGVSNPAAITPGTTGSASGHFYGPAANEAVGAWSIMGGGVQAMGSFGAKQ